MTYYIYILSTHRNGTLYVGITNNLKRRVLEHKTKALKGFTEKYNINRLVYFESTNDVQTALNREKTLKRWRRKWKLRLIESINPNWRDLNNSL